MSLVVAEELKAGDILIIADDHVEIIGVSVDFRSKNVSIDFGSDRESIWTFVGTTFVIEERKPNAVVHPDHYGGDTVYEVLKVIEAWDLGFCLGNAVKYIARAGKKDPAKHREDLEKARFYIKRELEFLEIRNKAGYNPEIVEQNKKVFEEEMKKGLRE